MLVATKVLPMLQASTSINTSLPQQQLEVSLDFNYSFLKTKIPNLTMILYDDIKNYLSNFKKEVVLSLDFNFLNSFGNKHQHDITMLSSKIIELNNVVTFEQTLNKVRTQITSKSIFSTKLIVESSTALSLLQNNILTVQATLATSIGSVKNNLSVLEKDLREVTVYYDILLFIYNYIIDNNILTKQQIESVDLFITRTNSLKTSCIIASQLQMTMQNILNSLELEQKQCSTFLNITIPAFVALQLNDPNKLKETLLTL
jgi:hypothetical protein